MRAARRSATSTHAAHPHRCTTVLPLICAFSHLSFFQMHMLSRVGGHVASRSSVSASGAAAAAAGAVRDEGRRAFSARAHAGVMTLAQRRAGVHTHRPVRSGAPVAVSDVDGLKETLHNPPPSIRSVIVRLLQTLSSKKEVDHYLRHYGAASNNFAVIKVGGGLIRDELEVLVSSLAFLVDVGLTPVVIHGAGPQLNAKLEAKGVVSEYHGGMSDDEQNAAHGGDQQTGGRLWRRVASMPPEAILIVACSVLCCPLRLVV